MLRIGEKCFIALLAIGCAWQPVSAQNLSAIVAFGDSLSDLGHTYNDLGDVLSSFIIGYDSYYYDQGRWSDGPLPTRVGHQIVATAAYNTMMSAQPALGEMRRVPLRTFSVAKE